MALIFSSLFPYDENSIAWLQIFQPDGSRPLALVTEPTDNPGRGPINADNELRTAILGAFPSLGDVDIFVRFLDHPGPKRWIRLPHAADGSDFERLTPENVLELCPAAAELSWDPEEHSCARLGGPKHPLLDLIPEPESERDRLSDLAIVAVADLPWMHCPGDGCPHHPRFLELEALYREDGLTPPVIGAHWFLTLSEKDFEACEHHDADWLEIAEASVEIFQDMGADAAMDTVGEMVTERFGNTNAAFRCLAMFGDPITWHPGQARVNDGQHRTCALKAVGAPFCIAETDGQQSSEVIAGEPVRRACAEIARYWAAKAAE